MLVQRNDAQASGCNTFKRLEMNQNSENRRLLGERRCCLMGYEEVAARSQAETTHDARTVVDSARRVSS